MIHLFNSVKSLLKLNKICIDNHIFRLHYKGTVILLIACSIMVTAKQFFGEPITCLTDERDMQRAIDTYCWIQSTFTIPNSFNKRVGTEVAHPGAGIPNEGEEVKYHKYYQWVCFMLFFQAICFYVPHYIWKIWESNRLRNLISQLDDPLLPNDKRSVQLNILASYLMENFGMHTWYAYRFFICEILNFINVILQILLVDRFLDYEFSSYGSQVLSFVEMEPEIRNDPMTRIFPKVTKCTFHKYGSSGGIQIFDSLCVLPLNIINEKIYVVLWFWFMAVAIVSGISIGYRCSICAFPYFRLQILRIRNKIVQFRSLSYVIENGDIGDWFILLQLARNIDQLTFKDLIVMLENLMTVENQKNVFTIDMVDGCNDNSQDRKC